CFTPPPCTGVFPDVPCPSTFAAWIETLAAEGITGGCGGGNFLPATPARPLPVPLRGVDRDARGRGNHRRLRRRQLLPRQPRPPRPDGGLPAEGGARPLLGAPAVPRPVPGLRLPVAVPRLDRAARRRGHHRRLRRRQLLSPKHRHPRTNGRVPGEGILTAMNRASRTQHSSYRRGQRWQRQRWLGVAYCRGLPPVVGSPCPEIRR